VATAGRLFGEGRSWALYGPLPSARDPALGKGILFIFLKKMLCRVPQIWHSAKHDFFLKKLIPCRVSPDPAFDKACIFFKKKRKIHIFFVFLNFWSSASRSSTRQSLSSDIFLETLFFTECHLTGPRQRLFLSCIYLFAECHNKTLGKVFFVYKLFSFLFTHYSDMHAKFWHIS